MTPKRREPTRAGGLLPTRRSAGLEYFVGTILAACGEADLANRPTLDSPVRGPGVLRDDEPEDLP